MSEWREAPKDALPGSFIFTNCPPPNETIYEVWGVKDDGRMELLLRNFPQVILNAIDNIPELKVVAGMYRDVWKKKGLIE